jgi:prepilin-type N-terminal cleavage/methylation domain-containing protein
MKNRRTQKGFSLIELLVAVAILMIVAGTVIAGMINTTRSESMVINRTQVHASVRNATELMEQEIGQAGRLPAVSASTPLTVQFAAAVAASALGTAQTPTITSTAGLFVGEQITVDPNSTSEETVTISAIAGNTVTAKFYNAHTTAVIPVMILGGFASGIVPPDSSSMLVLKSNGATNTPLTTQASTGSILKLYGDLKSDGNTYYVVYKCTQDQNGQGTLYRYESNTTDINTATAMNTGVLLLDNLGQNPGNTPCFTYQVKEPFVTINGGQVQQTFVINVAVTLTVQTQDRDAKTGQFQKETKALLNISPRNVFDAWELVSAPTGYTRAQPMPDNVFSTLLTANMTP